MARAHKCPCRGETLDRLLQPAVLGFLAREPLSGYRLLRRLATMRMYQAARPDPAGLYRCLKGLEGRGLVQGSWHLSRSGPASRTFTITPAGRQCLANWLATLAAYNRDLRLIMRLARNAAKGRKTGV